MAAPWEVYAQQPPEVPVPASPGEGPWTQFASTAAPPPKSLARKGVLWPVSYDEKGSPSFDSDAGILGSVKRFGSMFGEAAAGKFDATDPANTGRIIEGAMMASPVGAATRAGSTAIPALGRPRVPSAEALEAAGVAGYKASRDAGVEVAAAPVADWARKSIRSLEHDERIAAAAPETHKILNQLAEPPEGAFHTVQTLGGVQRALKEIAGKTNDNRRPTVDAGAATKALAELDSFLAKLPEEAVLAGPAAKTFGARKEADANYAAAQRSNDLTGRVERAEIRAGAANSGQNVDNTIRQRLADILTQKGKDRGYTPEELEAIAGTVQGGALGNTLRNVGGAIGGNGGWAASLPAMAGVGGALATGNPAVAALSLLPVAGMAMKQGAAGITKRKAAALDEATRARSPLYRDAPDVATVSDRSPEARTALIRSLLLEQQSAAGKDDPRMRRIIDALTTGPN